MRQAVDDVAAQHYGDSLAAVPACLGVFEKMQGACGGLWGDSRAGLPRSGGLLEERAIPSCTPTVTSPRSLPTGRRLTTTGYRRAPQQTAATHDAPHPPAHRAAPVARPAAAPRGRPRGRRLPRHDTPPGRYIPRCRYVSMPGGGGGARGGGGGGGGCRRNASHEHGGDRARSCDRERGPRPAAARGWRWGSSGTRAGTRDHGGRNRRCDGLSAAVAFTLNGSDRERQRAARIRSCSRYSQLDCTVSSTSRCQVGTAENFTWFPQGRTIKPKL